MSWRHAALLALSLLLGACATASRQPQRSNTGSLRMPPAVRILPPPPAPPPQDLWSRLRRGFAFAQCDGPRVSRWIGHYTHRPQRFHRQMSRAMPRLRYITDIILEAGLPAEFSLLPWVESNYRPLPPQGNRAAGVWQIMPATGRELGLRIDHRHDGRLDLDASTRAVTRLLKRDHAMVNDWRLTDMAFNAGVYRVRRLVADRKQPLSARPVPDLDVQPVTLDHLAKINALACIVQDPARFGVTLPDPEAGTHLVRRNLPKVLELPVASRLAGLPLADLRRFNHAAQGDTQPLAALIMPADAAPTFDMRYAQLEHFNWRQWQRVRIKQPQTLLALARDRADRAGMLATVNAMTTGETLPADAAVWLPVDVVAALPDDATEPMVGGPRRYTVRAGDSLWGIAHRFHLRVDQIRLWNRIRGNLLHLGQVLVLQPGIAP